MLSRSIIFFGFILSSGALFAQKNSELPLPPFASEVKDKPLFGKLSDGEMSLLKATLKSEILQELKAPVQEWKQDVQPQLNFLELDGYFRMRTEAFNHCDLGTYNPAGRVGTSGCPPPLSYFDQGDHAKPSWLLSANMRLRVDPTLNVSEDMRIKGTVDIFDNLVIGSTPYYMTGLDFPNPNMPWSILASTQNTPLMGINNPYGSINVKRLWGEVTTPAGELRFGRMPIQFGLGLFYNAGNQDTNDFGDNIDGVMFATRVFGHYLIPGVSVSYTGAVGRGRGYNFLRESGKMVVNSEPWARYDLDPVDNVYSAFLMFSKKDKELDAKALLSENMVVLNYGMLGSYRFQIKDSMYTKMSDDSGDLATIKKEMVSRDAHIGILSLWGDVRWNKLRIETEAVGILGNIASSQGLWGADTTKNAPIWIMQGGVALKSKYTFLNDRLEVGLDAGWASGGEAGERNTYFLFSPDYRIDMLLFNQILGTVSNAYYVRPHAGYSFTENLSFRADVISSFAAAAAGTPSKESNLLGLEIDGSLVYQSAEGFHLALQYGFLVPFAGMSHAAKDMIADTYKTASSASAIRLFAGISF